MKAKATRDPLTKEQRSKLMASIKGEDTQLELRVFALMRQVGLRFEKHAKDLPGRPDAVFRGPKVAVFVEGDFWHGWQFPRWRDKLTPYWREKIEENRRRDARNQGALRFAGWKVLRVWEHDVKKDPVAVAQRIKREVDRRRAG